MSASAVKDSAGARTQVANLVTWAATIRHAALSDALVCPLPEAVLAALIIHAVWHIIASRKLQKLRLESRVEFWFGVLALGGVLFIDVLEGMIIGLLASLLFVVYKRVNRILLRWGAFLACLAHIRIWNGILRMCRCPAC
jgi:sulfate permease, SulP family